MTFLNFYLENYLSNKKFDPGIEFTSDEYLFTCIKLESFTWYSLGSRVSAFIALYILYDLEFPLES